MTFDRMMERLIGALVILVLIGGTVTVVAPFVTALIWGAILAYCTWQPFLRLTALYRGRRGWASLTIVLLIFVLLLGPVLYAAVAFSTGVPELVDALQRRLAAGVPPLPDWLTGLPFVGTKLDELWNGLASRNPEIVARLRELAGPVFHAALGAALAILQGMGLLIISILFAAYYYVNGQAAAAGLRAGLQRIAGARTDYLFTLIGNTIKGVVYGILGTSLVQAALCAVGYWIAGLPSPGMLGLATFFLAILPGGPLLIIVPGAIWLTHNGQGGWAVFLIAWAGVAGIAIDNVLKPMLIGKSSHVPFILVMLGVLGGAAMFGLLGVFVGPTLLAVTHAIVKDWTAEEFIEQHGQRAVAMGPASSAGATQAAQAAARMENLNRKKDAL